jgi:hypothetical protein
MFSGFNVSRIIRHKRPYFALYTELSLLAGFWIGAKREKVKEESNMDRDSEL